MALDTSFPLVTWLRPRKRRAVRRSFLDHHRPRAWHVALLVGFVVVNETRGVIVAAQFVKAYLGS